MSFRWTRTLTVAGRMLAPLALLLASAAPLSAQAGVFLSEQEAVREVFPEATYVARRPWSPSTTEREAMQDRLGRELAEPEFPLLLVHDATRRFLGYALVTEERGKYRPITFLVGITPDGKVKDTAVMVYRESRGGEVRSSRFLRQYRGKTLRDPVRAGRDIVNVSGATISVHSLNAGVRKALVVVETAYGGGAPRVAAVDLSPLGSLR